MHIKSGRPNCELRIAIPNSPLANLPLCYYLRIRRSQRIVSFSMLTATPTEAANIVFSTCEAEIETETENNSKLRIFLIRIPCKLWKIYKKGILNAGRSYFYIHYLRMQYSESIITII